MYLSVSTAGIKLNEKYIQILYIMMYLGIVIKVVDNSNAVL